MLGTTDDTRRACRLGLGAATLVVVSVEHTPSPNCELVRSAPRLRGTRTGGPLRRPKWFSVTRDAQVRERMSGTRDSVTTISVVRHEGASLRNRPWTATSRDLQLSDKLARSSRWPENYSPVERCWIAVAVWAESLNLLAAINPVCWRRAPGLTTCRRNGQSPRCKHERCPYDDCRQRVLLFSAAWSESRPFQSVASTTDRGGASFGVHMSTSPPHAKVEE